MDGNVAERAVGWHMQHARRSEALDPEAAERERVHALDIAERFRLDRQITEVCGALCGHEIARYGAPLTERFVREGLAAATRRRLHVGTFLEYDALYEMERGALEAAERRFAEAIAHSDERARPRVLAGLGTLLLRLGRYAEARERFREGLKRLAGDNLDLETRLRLLDGCAEAERHAGDAAAGMTSSRVLEATKSRHKHDPIARRYRARAYSGRALLRWRDGARADAKRDLIAALEVWPEPDRFHVGEAFVAWERLLALELGAPAPAEGSPGAFCVIAWVRLGRDVLVPAELAESPPSRAALARARAWRPGDEVKVALRSLVGHQVGERWHVSRVQTLRGERRVLVELLAAGPVG